jgi:ADP-ribose pyrophosphatase YjhB (NUDIX family)
MSTDPVDAQAASEATPDVVCDDVPPGVQELSAGGVVVDSGRVVVIVPVKRAANGRQVLGLPKGHPNRGETLEQAARREVREEAGVEVEPLGDLGVVRYQYERRGGRIHKAVRFYLFRYLAGDVADHDHEIEVARWMPLEEAAGELTYEGEREMVRRAMSRLASER